MAGVLIDAGGAVANATLPEKADVFERPSPDQIFHGMNNDLSVWDENDRLVPEAQGYSDSTSILKVNHPLMIMVKEKRVVSINQLFPKNKLSAKCFRHYISYNAKYFIIYTL